MKTIIVGGGFAGLAAAVFLADKGVEVQLIESSPKLGGRAFSFDHNGYDVDNGQHILMGCYHATLSFLKKIDSYKYLDFPGKLRIRFLGDGGTYSDLKAISNFYPFNLIIGILKFTSIRLRDRLRILKFIFDLILTPNDNLKKITTEDWLQREGQDGKIFEMLWDLFHRSVMNDESTKTEASMFARVIKEMFLTGNKSTQMLIPNVGLSEMYVKPAIKYLNSHNCKIITSEKVEKIEYRNQKAEKVVTNRNEYSNFDNILFAIPNDKLQRIESEILLPKINFEYNAILSVHIWLKNNPFIKGYYGFHRSKIDWLFNHKTHISIVVSNPREIIKNDHDTIKEIIFLRGLDKYKSTGNNRKFGTKCNNRHICNSFISFTPYYKALNNLKKYVILNLFQYLKV